MFIVCFARSSRTSCDSLVAAVGAGFFAGVDVIDSYTGEVFFPAHAADSPRTFRAALALAQARCARAWEELTA